MGREYSNKCLIPHYINAPNKDEDEDEICQLSCTWGKDYFINHYPVLNRTLPDE